MTVKQFFQSIESANAFKKLIHEGDYRVDTNIVEGIYQRHLGTARSYKEFCKIIKDELHPDAYLQIVESKIYSTICHRDFLIQYIFDEETFSIVLCVS